MAEPRGAGTKPAATGGAAGGARTAEPGRWGRIGSAWAGLDAPSRNLGGVYVAHSVGRGIFTSGSAIYFTTVTGLSATEVGLGVSAAALSGFVASLLFGVLADRWGATRLSCAVMALQAVGFALYPTVHTRAYFFVLITLLGFVEYGSGPSFAVIVGEIFGPERRVRVRAALRSVFNAGFSIGSGVTALAVLAGGPALRALPLATAALMAVAAVLVLTLPPSTAAGTASRRSFGALRNTRFMAVTALSVPLALHASVILVVFPLWIVTRTDAPEVLVPVLLVGNTVGAILFQVRVSRGAETVAGASRLARRAGFWLAGACLLVAVTGHLPVAATVGVLCLAMLLFTVAELGQAASGWGLAYGLAPEDRQGEYQGAFQLHIVAQGAVGPGVLSAATAAYDGWGWVGTAVVVAAAALLIGPVVARAARHADPAPREVAS